MVTFGTGGTGILPVLLRCYLRDRRTGHFHACCSFLALTQAFEKSGSAGPLWARRHGAEAKVTGMCRQREGADKVCVFFLRHSRSLLACSLLACSVALVTCVGDWADSGDVRLRERHVRSAGVFATEHAEESGQAHPTLPAPPQPLF